MNFPKLKKAPEKTLYVLFALLIILVLFKFFNQASTDPSAFISKSQLQQNLQQPQEQRAILIDLRTSDELAQTGSIPGAIHKNFYDGDFAQYIHGLDPNKEYIVYCWSGVRSRRAAKLMRDQGLHVKDFSQGMRGWLR